MVNDDGAWLTTDGAVFFRFGKLMGYMHPDSYREEFGEEEYQALLTSPRIQSEYED